MQQPAPTRRMQEIDALRGIAALMVVLFHYTTRYQELYGHAGTPWLSLPWGHYGVNLFFMISGFVIFLTLEKTRRPLDFVVSRFSRLYPAYWAAVLITFALTSWLGLPGKEVSLPTALANLAMFHSLFGVAHVDGVYWTLEVELLFYAWALLAFRLGWLAHIQRILALLLGLRLLYWGLGVLGIDLPWIAFRLLILQFIPWFAAGMLVYRLVSKPADRTQHVRWLAGALLVIAIVDSPWLGLLALALSALLYLAASGRLTLLRQPWLAWLGGISYTLYLLHENIGWAILRRLQARGMDTDLSILSALCCILLLATLLTRLVERPAMHWLRAHYQRGRGAPATLAESKQA